MRRDVKKQHSAKGSIRVISGQWKGRKLPVLSADGLRPTTDRTKETLFNWLMPYVKERRCLDLFAGSGSLGIEALSRYAKSALFIEKYKAAADLINQNLTLLKVDNKDTRVICGDAQKVMDGLDSQFDLVFLDPPFNQNLLPNIMVKLMQSNLLSKGALIYVETELSFDENALPNEWAMLKQSQTKQMRYRLFIYE